VNYLPNLYTLLRMLLRRRQPLLRFIELKVLSLQCLGLWQGLAQAGDPGLGPLGPIRPQAQIAEGMLAVRMQTSPSTW